MKKLIIFLILAGLGAGAWFYFKSDTEDAPQYQTAALGRGDVVQAVTASGTLNPVLKVEVGSQISGNIQKLYADFNTEVKQGDVIAQLDPATYQANVNQAEGELANSEAVLNLARVNAKRQQELAANKLSTQAELDLSNATLLQAEASVKIRRAQLEKAKVDLARCTILAPVSGIVIARKVDVGQTVAASLSAPIIFLIANDLRKMQINTAVAEADVGQVEPGQKVEFEVDAFPSRKFHGIVLQVRNEPVTVQSVVTYDTIIEVSNDDLKLKPGMTATATIIITRRDDVLKIPNAALRFRPRDADKVTPPAPAPAAPTAPVTTSNPSTPGTPPATASEPSSGRGEGRPGGGRGPGGERRSSSGGGLRRERTSAVRTVYLLADGKPKPVQLEVGITDGIYTEVLEGMKEGDIVITSLAAPASAPGAAPGGPGASNPFGGGQRRRF